MKHEREPSWARGSGAIRLGQYLSIPILALAVWRINSLLQTSMFIAIARLIIFVLLVLGLGCILERWLGVCLSTNPGYQKQMEDNNYENNRESSYPEMGENKCGWSESANAVEQSLRAKAQSRQLGFSLRDALYTARYAGKDKSKT